MSHKFNIVWIKLTSKEQVNSIQISHLFLETYPRKFFTITQDNKYNNPGSNSAT